MEDFNISTDYPNGNDFVFEMSGFRFLGITTLLLLIFCYIINYGIFFLIGILGFLFILIPALYWVFEPLSRLFLRITSSKKTDFLDILPVVNFGGEWFMELDSEKLEMKNLRDVFRFIWKKKTDFFIIAPCINLAIIELWYYLGIFTIDPAQGALLENIINTSNFFYYSIYIPFIFMFYFSVAWVWDSAEIKLSQINASSAIHSKNQVNTESYEVNELQPASVSLQNIMLFFAGINVLNWAAQIELSLDQTGDFWVNFVFFFIFFVILSSGYSIFIGVMYYRSSIHAKIVNKLRRDIWVDYSQSKMNPHYKRKYNIDVRRSIVSKIVLSSPPSEGQIQNYRINSQRDGPIAISTRQPKFCTACGLKIEYDGQRFCKGCGNELL